MIAAGSLQKQRADAAHIHDAVEAAEIVAQSAEAIDAKWLPVRVVQDSLDQRRRRHGKLFAGGPGIIIGRMIDIDRQQFKGDQCDQSKLRDCSLRLAQKGAQNGG